MSVTRLQHPFVLEPGQQRSVAERERLVARALVAQPVGFEHVDPGVGGEPDALAGRHERTVPQRAARSAQSALRRLARALSSSTSGQKRGATSERGCRPGLSASQPRSDSGRPRRERPALAVDLGLDLAHETHAQHRQSVQRDD